MRFNIKRCLIILLACIFIPLSVLTSGFSKWYVLDNLGKGTQTTGNSLSSNASENVTINGSTLSNPGIVSSDKVPATVNFYYWTMAQTGSSTTQGTATTTPEASTSGTLISSPAAPTVSFTVNGKTFSAASTVWTGYTKPYLLHTFDATETLNEETGELTKTYQIVYVTNATDKTSGAWNRTRKATVTYRVDTVTETYQAGLIKNAADTGYEIFHTQQVAFGNTVARPTLTYGNYTLIGFYNNANNKPTTEFDFSKPITTDDVNANKVLSVIVQWSTQPETGYDTSAYTSLTDTVNSLSGSLNVYSGGAYDITKDVSYSSSSASVNLGKTSSATTIKSGATLNLCMNNGAYHHMATDGYAIKTADVAGNEKHGTVGDDVFASLDYTGKSMSSAAKNVANPRDYTVRLQNDLTINGTLNLGGYTGANPSSGFAPQGSIIGNYVKLDLNGHTITVANGGVLHSFGYITDSVGSGKIIVKTGGHLYSQMVVASLKGGNNTLWSYAQGISPFENYYFPYLDTTVELEATSSGAGNFTAFTKFNLGSLGFTNMYFPVIGGDSSYMFYIKAKSGAQGKATLTNEEVDNLNVTPFTYQSLNKKNCFNFTNVDTVFVPPTVNVTVSIDVPILGEQRYDMSLELDRIIFPLSSFLDVNFYSSTMSLTQKIQILPGSSLMFDSNSELILDYYKNSSGTITQKSFSKKEAGTKSMPAVSKYMVGGILAMDNDPIENAQYIGTGYDVNYTHTTYGNYTPYWDKVFKSGNVDIYGNVKFVTNNTSAAPYTLAGNINVNTFSTSANTGKKAWNSTNLATLSDVYFNSYDMQIYSGIFYWFGSDNIFTGSNDGAYSAAYHFYALPMISNGVAYLYDSTNKLQGSYNGKTGIFTATTGTKYFFKANNSLLTNSSNQESAIDYSLTPTACTELKSCLITAGSTNYAYFGGLYFPITSTGVTAETTSVTANLQKFHSATDYSAKTLTYQSEGYWKVTA